MAKSDAKRFAEDWAGRGYERGETAQFWDDLLQRVLGLRDTYGIIKYEVRAANGGLIDAFMPNQGVLIEQKALGVDLDAPEPRQGRMVTPFEQALDYAEGFPRLSQPRWIVTCNFSTFRIYDRDAWNRAELPSHFLEVSLEEVGENPSYLGFMADKSNSRETKEREASIKAGELIGELYDELVKFYDEGSAEDLHALNVLCVRLVFCLFAEDAGLFEKDALFTYLKDVPPQDIGMALDRLFVALDTPKAQRNRFDVTTAPFPYVNGGLFAERVPVPPFDVYLKNKLLVETSKHTDWSRISPTIFGGIFESTLNPETRRQGGMHYTSPENIHKVIDPLFLDDLRAELRGIVESDAVPRKRKVLLEKFHEKISNLDFLDPACGSGNFLTETYLCLRDLENDCLNAISALDRRAVEGQMSMIYDTSEPTKHVSLDQFHGIEINDFAVRVAKTALWIAKLQADGDGMAIELEEPFPLHEAADIVCGNALRLDWDEVIPPANCDYIIGNPPFLGSSIRSKTQTEDLEFVFADDKKWGKCDYCVGWYRKAADFMVGTRCRAAFVSTNSITQGEQVEPTWRRLFDMGLQIDYAHRTFVWNSEAADRAHVHCVIVGFSYCGVDKRLIIDGNGTVEAKNINGYLSDAPSVFLKTRSKPIDEHHAFLTQGSKLVDGGNLILSQTERDDFVHSYPGLADLVMPLVGGAELLNGKSRYCLWLRDIDQERYSNNPFIVQRLEGVRQTRLASPTQEFRDAAVTPWLFEQDRQPSRDYLAAPKVSSQKRVYLPFAWLNKEVIATDQLWVSTDATIYDFAIASSLFHNAWLRRVAGRMKSDYRFNPVVYNTLVYPEATEEQRLTIESAAYAVLEVRKRHNNSTLAILYDPDKMPDDLLQAHKALDRAVEAAYGVDFDGDEEKIVAHLFKLYAEKTGGLG